MEARLLIMLNLLTQGATTNCRDFEGETCVAYVRRWMAEPSMLAAVDRQHLGDLMGMLVEIGVITPEERPDQGRGCQPMGDGGGECAVQ